MDRQMSAGDLATLKYWLESLVLAFFPKSRERSIKRLTDEKKTGAELRSEQSARASDQINKRERMAVLRRLYLGSMLHKCRQSGAHSGSRLTSWRDSGKRALL
jgi:hypothetical protein